MVSSPTPGNLPKSRPLLWTGWFAVGTVWLVGLLALVPEVSDDFSIPLTLLVLLIGAVVVGWTPLCSKLEKYSDIAMFGVTAAMFVIYGLARRFDGGLAQTVHSGIFMGDEYALSPAAFLVFAGAVLSLPAWWRHFRGWLKAVIIALLTLAILGFGSFWFLGLHYPVGAVERLDPTPLLPLAMNLLEFFFLTLVCIGACATETMRKVLLRSFPILLLLLFCRHTFIQPVGGDQ